MDLVGTAIPTRTAPAVASALLRVAVPASGVSVESAYGGAASGPRASATDALGAPGPGNDAWSRGGFTSGRAGEVKSSSKEDFYFTWSAAGFSLFSRSFSRESDRKLFTGGLPRGFHLGLTMRHILDFSDFGRALDLFQAEGLLPYDLAMCSVFALDYLLRWLATESPLTYVFTPPAVVDFFTTFPVFIQVTCIVFLAAAIFQLIEADQNLTFLECTFIVVPMQASKLASLVESRSKYAGRYVVTPVPHVVVVGSLSPETVSHFFNEFNHAAHSSLERIVFLSPLPPSSSLVTLLTSRHYVARCVFLVGSVFEDTDLLRAGVPEARAVFVLSDPRLPVGDLSGDQATVMRVQSIRGLTARPAILAEVVNSGYKTALLTAGANQAICIDDVMAGVIAMSALCPGFSTWFTNMFVSNSPALETPMLGLKALEALHGGTGSTRNLPRRKSGILLQAALAANIASSAGAESIGGGDDDLVPGTARGWRAEYDYGASFEVYSMEVPARYNGCTFSDAACDIYLLHGAVLIGVKCDALRVPVRGRERYRRCPPGHDDGAYFATRASHHTIRPDGDAVDAVPVVILNPGAHFVLREGDHALILATDIKDVDVIRVTRGPVFRHNRDAGAAAVTAPTPVVEVGESKVPAPGLDPSPRTDAARHALESREHVPAATPTDGASDDSSEAPHTGRADPRCIRDAGGRAGHIIILGGSTLHRLTETLRGLRSATPDAWRDVIIVARVPVPADYINDFPCVYWLAGDPLHHDVLRAAGVPAAFSIIVLMDRPDCSIDIQDKHATIATREKYLVDYDAVAAFSAVRNFDTPAHVLCDLMHLANGRLLNVRRRSMRHLAHGMFNCQRPVLAVAQGSLSAPEELPRAPPHRGGAGRRPAETAAHVAAAVVSSAAVWAGGDVSGLPRAHISAVRERVSAWGRKLAAGSTPGDRFRVSPAPAPAAPALGLDPAIGETQATWDAESTHSGSTAAAAAAVGSGVTPVARAAAARERRIRVQLAHEALSRKRVMMQFFETESYTAGAFFSRSMLRVALAQAYYNPFVVTLAGVLLRPGPLFSPSPRERRRASVGGGDTGQPSDAEDDADSVAAMVETFMTGAPAERGQQQGGAAGSVSPCAAAEFEQSYVRQFGVPPRFIGRPYHELFVWMVARGALPLALMRAPTPGGASHPYVYSAPRPTALLNRFDRLFGAAPTGCEGLGE